MTKNGIRAIAIAGFTAGLLDLTQAIVLFGWTVPVSIAAGLVGRQTARSGGAGIYTLGVLLHFVIAVSFAAAYYFVSRRLRFLAEHWLVCGLFYGMAVELVMDLVVLPLSALHARGPFALTDLILGLAVHMVVVGVPIAYCVRRFGHTA